MTTWQEGNGGRFLAGIGSQNDNAPRSGDNSLALGLIRKNNDFARAGGNNIGLQALQGLSGIAGMYQKEQQQNAINAFNDAHAQAWKSGDTSILRDFAAANPAFVSQAQQAVSGLDDQQKAEMGKLATGVNTALSQGPEAFSKFVTDNSDSLKRIGADPNWMIQAGVQNPEQLSHFATTLALGSVGTEKAFEVQDRMTGRQQEQQRINETVRNNDMTNARGIRGQNLNYQSAMTGHNLAAQRLALDQQEFGLKVQQAQEKSQQLISEAPKLSVNMEKGIETAVNNATASSNSADSMSALAQQFRQEKPTTGLFGNANNMFSKLTGSETALRDLRIRQNAIINSQVLKYLPPGPATDRDVNLAREGAPSSWDDPEIVANWLDANARLERRNAQFNEFKSEWMSANGNPGQSRNGGQILGMDVQKGESLGSAVKRYMANNPVDNATDAKPTGAHTSKSGIRFTVE